MPLIEPKKYSLKEFPMLHNIMFDEMIKNSIVTILLFAIGIVSMSLKFVLLLFLFFFFLWGFYYHRYYLITRDKLCFISGICEIRKESSSYDTSFSLLKKNKQKAKMYIKNDEFTYIIYSSAFNMMKYNQKMLYIYTLPNSVFYDGEHVHIRNAMFVCNSKGKKN